MTTEEKAKAYDEAVKKATHLHRFSSDPAEIKRMEQLFPELKESEDERIRKELIKKVQIYIDGDIPCGYDAKKALAWLEKQGEQKPAEWSEEDKNRLNRICDFLWKNRKGDTSEIYQQEKDIAWLKSLRPQNHWKPSEEQLLSLRQVISGCSYDIKPLLEIEEQLRKL